VIEWIVVGTAVAGALAFLGWRLMKSWKGGCGDSCKCASKPEERFRV